MGDRGESWRRSGPEARGSHSRHGERGDPYNQPENLDYGSTNDRSWRSGRDISRERKTYDRRRDRDRWRSDATDRDTYNRRERPRYGNDWRDRRDKHRDYRPRDDPYTQPRPDKWVPPPREDRWEDDGDVQEHHYDAQEQESTDNGSTQMAGPDDPDAQMAAIMGFGSFDTSKGKPVEGNDVGYAHIKKERTWRQYMNRCVLWLTSKGGFNRPLDKI